ncbi:MAG: hypothetical protein AMJ46_14545, partial [Latescibacteria bacterium DG_63]
AGAAGALYRSVGTNASNLNTSNRTVTISGSTATFSGSMPDNVGVGDVLTYSAGGNQLAFIHGRTTSTVFTVKNKDGGTPAAAPAGTAVGVYRAYTSLYNWERGSENSNITEPTEDDVNPSTDLVSTGTVMMVPCYADGNDSSVVTINGWTTGPGNYIKIYTPTAINEVGTSQRHNGTWGGGGYARSVSTTGNALLIEEENVWIEGLRLGVTASSGSPNPIRVAPSGTGTDVRISHCIIRGVLSDTVDSSEGLIISGSGTGTVRIWNNIVYDFNIGTECTGIENWAANMTVYLYNNTVYNCLIGIWRSDGTLVAKNNIAYNNGDNYSGTFDDSSTNNLSGPSQSDARGSNPRNAVTVTFVNEAGDDFHLASTDAGAKQYGADLSADPYIAFSDDIDGEVRVSGSWDIGADECHIGGETWHTISAAAGSGGSITPSGTVSVIEGADQGFTITADTGYIVADVVVDGSSVGAVTTYTFTNVTTDHSITTTFTETGATTATLYRSVGTNASNLNTNNRTVTISDSTATFSGSMPADVGVGDALTYNSGGNRLAFIHGRTSSTVFTVRDKDGNEPTAASAGTAVGVYRAYTSLANWESQTENPNITEPTENDVNPSTNLVSANTVIMVACYADGVDTTGLSIDGWITGPDNYIRIYTPTSTSQVGISQRHTGTAGTGYRIDPDTNGIRIGESYTQIEGLEVFDFGESGYSTCGIRIYGDYAHSCTISYCLIHSEVSDNGGAAIAMDPYGSFSNNKIFNNIIYDVYYGIGVDIGPQDTYVYNNTVVDCSLGIYSDESVIAKNNIAYNNADNYSGTFESTSTNNLSGPTQTDARGSNPRNAVTVTFVNEAGNNFHLAESDTGARGYGADLSSDPDLPLSFDIDGDTRSGTWDIGADEYDVGGATYTITAVSGPGGSITPSGTVSVSEGGEATFTITPDTGYVITDVQVDGTSVHAVSSYTFTNVDANHTIVASFDPTPTYTITVNQASGGVISPGGTVTVTQGADQTFIIVPATGYAVADVLVDGVSVGAVTSYTFTNIHANHTITAVFEEAPTFTISASAENYGSISPEGEVVLNWGGSETFTITPDPGYGVADVLVDGVSVGAVTLYAFSNVTADHTIVASFIVGGQHTIIAVAESGGSISPSGTITLDQGQSQTFTITPDAGNSVSDVEVDGVSWAP